MQLLLALSQFCCNAVVSFHSLTCLCSQQRRDDFPDDDDRVVPTKEGIEREEEKLEELQQAQKNLFLIIFQVQQMF